MIPVTGGCGFIGSAFILDWLAQSDKPVLNLASCAHRSWVEQQDPRLCAGAGA